MININIKENDSNFFVTVNGEIEMLYIKDIKQQLMVLAENNNKDIELDLSDVEYIDSSGIGLLLSLLKILRKKNKKLYISKVSDKVLSILKISSLSGVFDL